MFDFAGCTYPTTGEPASRKSLGPQPTPRAPAETVKIRLPASGTPSALLTPPGTAPMIATCPPFLKLGRSDPVVTVMTVFDASGVTDTTRTACTTCWAGRPDFLVENQDTW